MNDRIEEISKRLAEMKTASDKQKVDGKKIGEDGVNQMKVGLEKEIKDLSLSVDNKNKLTNDKIQDINKKLTAL